jgi:hypothetical protein
MIWERFSKCVVGRHYHYLWTRFTPFAVGALISGTVAAFPLTMTTLGPQAIANTDGDFFDQ